MQTSSTQTSYLVITILDENNVGSIGKFIQRATSFFYEDFPFNIY
jgi:hypothetical protein